MSGLDYCADYMPSVDYGSYMPDVRTVGICPHIYQRNEEGAGRVRDCWACPDCGMPVKEAV